MRWWIPATLIAIALGVSLYLRSREFPYLEPTLLAIGMLTALLVGVWFIFFTGLRWRTRWLLTLAGCAFLAGTYFGVKGLTRVEGSIGGSGIPRLVWKWSPRPEGAPSPVMLESASATPAPTNAAALLRGRDYPQFLGLDRSGILSGIPLERDWERFPPKPVWQQPIGLGWSAFAVSGQHAITQEQRHEDELIVGYDLLSGRALWAHTNRVRFSESLGGDGPRATPTIKEGRVYAMGATGILDCLEEATGRLIWSHDVLKENNLSNITWGKSCSPLLANGLVVVTGGDQREKSLLAYEAETGKLVWQAGRDKASYCSPQLGVLSGQEQIIMVNAHSVTGHDLQRGEILWEYLWPDKYAKATQPLVVDSNRVFVAAGYGVGCVMLKVARTAAGTWSVEALWRNRNLKPKFTNLVRRGGHVYGLDEGVLTCLNLETGNREWKEGRYGHGQVLLVDDLLLVQAEAGDVALVEASPKEAHELGRFPAIKGKTWNNPVLSNDLLLVRNDHQAACYRLPIKVSRD